MKNRFHYILGLFLIGAMSSAQAAKPTQVVAEVNGQAITLEQFNQRYNWYVERFKFKMPKKEFLKNLIDLEVSSQEAMKQGVSNEEKMKYDYKVLLSQHLLEKEVYGQFDKIKISDRDLKKSFKESPEIRASHILFKLEANADAKKEEEIKKKAQEILDKIKKGEDFTELAKKYSEGPSAKNGGDLDFFTRDSMVPEFSEVAFKLKKVGDVSDLVRTKYGFHIIKLTGIRDFKSADKRRLQNQVKSQKQKEIYEGFFSNLKKNAKITINENLIED